MLKFPKVSLPKASFADSFDKGMNVVLTNKDFLRTASVVINLNSYRRKWTRAAIQKTLTTLELPVRTDQEKMLALLEKLNHRLEDLEGRVNAQH